MNPLIEKSEKVRRLTEERRSVLGEIERSDRESNYTDYFLSKHNTSLFKILSPIVKGYWNTELKRIEDEICTLLTTHQ